MEEDIFKNEKELKSLIDNFDELLFGEDKELIMDAYKLEKPLTSLELYDRNKKLVFEFINQIKKYFFIEVKLIDIWELAQLVDEVKYEERNQFYGEIFLSRFKTLPKVAIEYDDLSDKYADLAGVLYGGHSLIDIAEYCQQERLEKLFK